MKPSLLIFAVLALASCRGVNSHEVYTFTCVERAHEAGYCERPGDGLLFKRLIAPDQTDRQG